ncbi:MAG: hypothetical protein KJO84_06205 [Acidimicrobiia bacterium]|nr:hypothetical protein [Acidimicrobiia bacterium]NNC75670.1 hypothetical protein [Acidimicrobiia bacterium]
MHRTTLILGVVITTAMVVMIGIGIASGGFIAGLETVWGDVWGRVTLIDLAVGLIAVGAWIALREGSVARAVPWWIALVFTGNLATGVYLIRVGRRSASVREVLIGET